MCRGAHGFSGRVEDVYGSYGMCHPNHPNIAVQVFGQANDAPFARGIRVLDRPELVPVEREEFVARVEADPHQPAAVLHKSNDLPVGQPRAFAPLVAQERNPRGRLGRRAAGEKQ